jgi:hypothetical protein
MKKTDYLKFLWVLIILAAFMKVQAENQWYQCCCKGL